MADFIFRGIFDTEHTAVITPGAFVLCVGVSLLIGLLLCAMTLWRAKSSGSFAVTLALLPAVVCVVIMMVNGKVGTGVIDLLRAHGTLEGLSETSQISMF